MSKAINITGNKYGKLTALKSIGSNKNGVKIWLCKCDCGHQTEVLANSLRSGNTSSCGCTKKQILINRNHVHGLIKKNAKLYRVWRRMRQRCNDKNCTDFIYYGARGIKVCREWDDYSNFYKWALSNGYKENLTIDRNNVDGDYEPLNCSWVTNKIQARNKRNNHYITFNGKRKTLAEWSEITGIGSSLIRYRLKNNWDKSRIFNKPNKYQSQ